MLLDALPYVDVGGDEASLRAAEAMVAVECQRIRSSRNGANVANAGVEFQPMLPPLRWFAASPMLSAEWARIKAGDSLHLLQDSQPLRAPNREEADDVNEWKKAIRQMKIAFEEERNTILNIELYLKYGKDAWHIYIARLEEEVNALNAEIKSTRSEIDSVNYHRKLSQESVIQELQRIELKVAHGIRKCHQISLYNHQLRDQNVSDASL